MPRQGSQRRQEGAKGAQGSAAACTKHTPGDGNTVVVTGGTVQRSTALQLPSIAGFSVKFPATGGNEFLDVGKVKPLAPGSYGSINVQRDAQLLLSTGTYFIDRLTVESMGRVKVNSTNGPVYLHPKSGLKHRGAVFAKQLDIQAQALFVHHPFIGTWNAPTSF